MLEIDGGQGEGGGQILRSALALSLATGRPFRLANIRANRSRPGLRPQHLASVRAATLVGEAHVEGAEKGSSELLFQPRAVRTGDFDIDVGTAGSATLVLQTVLPPLLTAAHPSRVTVTGGTHNPFAPPFEFLERTYLPILRRLGPGLRVRMGRPGFLPVGGGRVTLEVDPSDRLARLELLERGEILDRQAVALVSRLPKHIAQRELGVVRRRLGWPRDALHVRPVENAKGPGNALVLLIECEHVTEVFFQPGEKNVRAETVALRAVMEAFAWLDAHVPVGEHLADQLLLPLALGSGGVFRTVPLSSHAHTQIDLLHRFLDVRITTEPTPSGGVEVQVEPA